MDNLHSFETIRFGVNYVPSQRWWYAWNDFKSEDIARDFDAICELGADHVRIMLIWPFFQPNRGWISESHLDRLDQLMELAVMRRLDVCPALLTGWLSGWAFRPNFEIVQNFYEAQEMRQPVERYFKACAKRLNQHKNFLGFDLGNEMNCCWKASNVAQGDSWMNWIMDVCEIASPQAIHVNGVDHQPWFYPDTFSAQNLARRQSLIALHSWIEFTGARQRGEVFDRTCTHLAPAMAALARLYAGDSTKPVWLQEFGASPHWMEEDKIPSFLEEAVHAAIAGGICRLTWWASHDINLELEFPNLEYDLGLISVKNQIKPAGRMFQQLVNTYRGKPVRQPQAITFPPLPDVSHCNEKTGMEETWKWLKEAQILLL